MANTAPLAAAAVAVASVAPDWRARGASAADLAFTQNDRDCIDLHTAWEMGEMHGDDSEAAHAYLRGYNVRLMILTAEDPNDGRPNGPRFSTAQSEEDGVLFTLEDLELRPDDQTKALALGLDETCEVDSQDAAEGMIEIRRVGPAPINPDALTAAEMMRARLLLAVKYHVLPDDVVDVAVRELAQALRNKGVPPPATMPTDDRDERTLNAIRQRREKE